MTILASLQNHADVRMARPDESFTVGTGRQASAWTTWTGARPTVVLTPSADLHTCVHELAHILLGHGSCCADFTDRQRAQLEIDAETGAIALLASAGVITPGSRDRATTYVLGWLGVNPDARPSQEARELRIA